MINLSESDRNSHVWQIVKSHLIDSLEKLQRDNEKFSNTPERTAAIRGKIELIRELLKTPSADKTKSTELNKYW